MLRKTLNVNWKAHMTNKELYGDLPKITSQIRKRRLQFTGTAKEMWCQTWYHGNLPREDDQVGDQLNLC